MGILASFERSKPGGSGIEDWKPASPVAAMAGTVIGLHVVGWGVLVCAICSGVRRASDSARLAWTALLELSAVMCAAQGNSNLAG